MNYNAHSGHTCQAQRPIRALEPMDKEKRKKLQQKLKELQLEHRDMDDVIMRLANEVYVDQLQLRRLKKRKLLLKDMIIKIESKLIPDILA